MAYILNPLLRQNLQKKQDVFKGSFFIKLEDGSEIDAKELIESIEDILGELNKKLDVKQSKANAILITNNNGNITPVEGVVMQQAERDKLASLQVNAISNKIQSENSFVETDGDTIKAFGNKLQSGRFPDTSNSENLLVVGNGSSQDSTSNALELTYNGELKAQNDVIVGEHKLSNKLDANDLPDASNGITICKKSNITYQNTYYVLNSTNIEEIEIPENGVRILNKNVGIKIPFNISKCEKIELINPFSDSQNYDLVDLIKSNITRINKIYNNDSRLGGAYIDFIINGDVIELDSKSYGILGYKTAVTLFPVKITLKTNNYTLSIDKTEDKPFGYNPAKDEWQTVESVNLQFTEMPDVETTDLESIQYVGEETDKYKKGHWYKKGSLKVYKNYVYEGNYLYYDGNTILTCLTNGSQKVDSVDDLIDYVEYYSQQAGENLDVKATDEFVAAYIDTSLVLRFERGNPSDDLVFGSTNWEDVSYNDNWNVTKLPKVDDYELGYTLRKDGKIFILNKTGFKVQEYYELGHYFYITEDLSKVFVNKNSTTGEFELPVTNPDDLVPIEKMYKNQSDNPILYRPNYTSSIHIYIFDNEVLEDKELYYYSLYRDAKTDVELYIKPKIYYEYNYSNDYIYIDSNRTDVFVNNSIVDFDYDIWVKATDVYDLVSVSTKIFGYYKKPISINISGVDVFIDYGNNNIVNYYGFRSTNKNISYLVKEWQELENSNSKCECDNFILSDGDINSATAMSKTSYASITNKDQGKLYFLYEEK